MPPEEVTAQLKPGFGRHAWSPADHENRSDTLLKLLDSLTDRGLSDVERLRGAIEASLAHNRGQCNQGIVIVIHAHDVISIRNSERYRVTQL